MSAPIIIPPQNEKPANKERWQDRITGFLAAFCLVFGYQFFKPQPPPDPAGVTFPDRASLPHETATPPAVSVTPLPITEATAATAPSPSEVQVWVNLNSGVYHMPGARWYGNTSNGAYMGVSEANAKGYRAAANGQ